MNNHVILSDEQWICISLFIRNMAMISGIESNIDEETLNKIFNYFLNQERELVNERLND